MCKRKNVRNLASVVNAVVIRFVIMIDVTSLIFKLIFAVGACDRIFVEDKKIIEKSISPAGSITEELPQQDIVPTADARLDFSSIIYNIFVY